MKRGRWKIRKKPMWPIHHLLLPRPKNMLDLLAWAVAAMDLFPKQVPESFGQYEWFPTVAGSVSVPAGILCTSWWGWWGGVLSSFWGEGSHCFFLWLSATTTHGCPERHPAHATAERCRDFRSKQIRSHGTSLEVLVDSSGAKAECADAWQDKLCESLCKEDAIFKEVQDTMRNLKDVVNESNVELQKSQDTFNDAFQSMQKYLNKQV
ncbi:PREDICTED: uncharacterized protein LOC109308032 [Crocodylus porosus]|uniref:uncharacterized protein LOC109308032 n=1 Tax=Crocodylus porosus TaxID=8502 RepID=UPI00093DCF59|nr:PREDICTED: uncharacterized protein LOC109308032 [Crocodylus porosus]